MQENFRLVSPVFIQLAVPEHFYRLTSFSCKKNIWEEVLKNRKRNWLFFKLYSEDKLSLIDVIICMSLLNSTNNVGVFKCHVQ